MQNANTIRSVASSAETTETLRVQQLQDLIAKNDQSDNFYTTLFSSPEIFTSEGDIDDLVYYLPGVEIDPDNTVRYNGKEAMSMYLNPSKYAENYWKYLDGGENELTDEEIQLLDENGSETAIRYLDECERMMFEREEGRFDGYTIPR